MRITERIDRVTHLSAAVLTEMPPAPRSVKIELCARCNYRCSFCAVGTRITQSHDDMDFELFTRISRELREAGVEEFGLFLMGESFLAPALLVQAVEYLKTELRVPYVFLTSNASIAHPPVVSSLMAAGLDSLKWSVTTTPEHVAEVLGVAPHVHAAALRNIRSAWEMREQHGYATRLYASSIAGDASMQAFLADSVLPYVDEHYWLPLYSMGGLTSIRGAVAGNPGRSANPVASTPCWQLFSEAHVLVDGRLTACSFDAIGRWVVGDLTQQSFLEAWHSAEFRALRRAHLAHSIIDTQCKACLLGSEVVGG